MLTKEELKSHQDTRNCKLSKSINYRKFRDNCHYIGKYRGEAHRSNLNVFGKIQKSTNFFSSNRKRSYKNR